MTLDLEQGAGGSGGAQGREDLDRRVLIMSVAVWAVYFGLLTSRSLVLGAAMGPYTGDVEFWQASALRAGMMAFSIALCWCMHVWLRRSRGLNMRTLSMRTIGLALPAAVVISVSSDLSFRVLHVLTGRAESILFLPTEFAMNFIYIVWVFVSWAALYLLLHYVVQSAERDRRLAAAQLSARDAQLTALRFQLQPHFLFNGLNTLSGLVVSGRSQHAEEMILNLSSFLRYSLAKVPSDLVPLSQELDAIQRYLCVETIRFSDRLSLRFDVDAEAHPLLVPSLILQPLIENVMKHAVSRSESLVELVVGAKRIGDQLTITVENNRPGQGAEPRDRAGFGIGLNNVRQRLSALYDGEARLDAGPTPEGGWRNTLSLPARRS